MLLTRLYLRNFRVYEQELDLPLPPGLVGIYGPNGAGKSTLLESILWTLWGKARTAKDDIRSAGVNGDCITEVEFEHEGHLYLVRRSISGTASTVRAEAHADGLIMAEGVRDTARYVHSVLGMDDGAFRASVFTEQKQLASFSEQTPGDRRKLVLQLLGITPLDTARDNARRDARDLAEQHKKLRAMLPDLEAATVSAADAEARAAAAEALASEEERAAATTTERATAAQETWHRLDLIRQEHEALVAEGKAARAELDRTTEQTVTLAAELEQLASAEAELAALQPLLGALEADEARLDALRRVEEALAALGAIRLPEAVEVPDAEVLSLAQERAESARAQLAEAEGRRRALEAERDRARLTLSQSSGLSGEADCPLCGQALGDAFAQVQAHRQAELADAEARLTEARTASAQAQQVAADALAVLQEVAARVEAARRARQAFDEAMARRAEAAQRLAASAAGLGPADRDLASTVQTVATAAPAATGPIQMGGVGQDPAADQLGPLGDLLLAARAATKTDVERGRQAAQQAARLRGRLERRAEAERTLAVAQERRSAAESRVMVLRDKVKGLGFEPAALAAAQATRTETVGAASEAERRARLASTDAIRARADATAEARRLAEAQAQHGRLGELELESRHLSRLAELINAFRNAVVASVGPRLAIQAAELFGELTDNEYDQLEVDPETYGLQIRDAGQLYDLERFSGSEVDLANLAMRVAISEHIRFQSGGTVGLLVLDEVFGPLDDDRKARMLQALERLKGRFRQVLVVTHSADIKEQLPNAIEVVKRPGRRATARVVGD